MSHLIWSYTVCPSVLELQLSPFWGQWMCTNAAMEESISETGLKGLSILKYLSILSDSF